MSDDDLIRRGDALKAVNSRANSDDSCHAPFLRHDIAALPAVTVGVPTEAQIASACLSYDHSFGLMDGPQRVAMMHQAREWLHAWRKEFAALEPVAAPDPVHRPTMTDMMVDPDTLDAFMEANPLPDAPDPAAIREAALREALKALDSLPEYGSPDVNIGVSNAYSAILALIQKGADGG